MIFTAADWIIGAVTRRTKTHENTNVEDTTNIFLSFKLDDIHDDINDRFS